MEGEGRSTYGEAWQETWKEEKEEEEEEEEAKTKTATLSHPTLKGGEKKTRGLHENWHRKERFN